MIMPDPDYERKRQQEIQDVARRILAELGFVKSVHVLDEDKITHYEEEEGN